MNDLYCFRYLTLSWEIIANEINTQKSPKPKIETVSNLCDLCFSCFITLARSSSTMLNQSGESGHPCLVPDIRGKNMNRSRDCYAKQNK